MGKPPGPRGREVLGFFGGGQTGRTLRFLESTARRYGSVSYFRILTQRIYLLDDPALIEEVLVTRQHEFVRDNGATLLRELVGDGVLTSEEPRHRERRRVLQPAFHRAQIGSYASVMTRETGRMAHGWQAGETLDMGREMKRLTLSIVGAALFGSDFAPCADRVAAVLERVIRRSARIAPAVAFLEPLLQAYRRTFPQGRSVFYATERAELERAIEPAIAQRRRDASGDILSLMLGHMDDREITNEVITLVLAGHETTATALTWAWYLLARHPGVEACLHAEVKAVLDGADPGLDDLPRLPYTAAVFAEALRLYPPALAFGRRPAQTLSLGGYRIPRGSSLILSPFITQRNGQYFPEPERFDPGRWIPSPPIPKFAYFPFGGGAKMCIGDGFARMEGVLVLAAMAQRFRLELVDEGPVGLDPSITLRPSRPIRMRVWPRS